MSLLPLSGRLLKPVGTAAVSAGLAVSAVVGVHAASSGTAAAQISSTSASTSPQSGTKAGKQHRPVCNRLGLRLGKKAPQALRSDLAAVRAKLKDSDATGSAKATERREALATIRQGIEDGKYGKDLQERAQKREARVEKRRAALPAKLRSDLAALEKAEPGPARREAAKKIREGRLDGSYGSTVQARAKKQQERREQRRQTCQAQRHQRAASKSAHPSAQPSTQPSTQPSASSS